MKDESVLISIVIPVRNEGESLPQLIKEIDDVISQVDYCLEVLFINDASTDNSEKILREFEQRYVYVRTFHLPERRGQTGCYQLAFQEARGKYIIRMDGDLQDNPHDLHQFFPFIEQDMDIVMGLRELRKHRRLLRFASILYDSFVVLLFDSPLHTNTSSFIAFKAKYLKGITFKYNDHRHLPIIAMQRGAERIKEVVVTNRERRYGVSKYNDYKKILIGVPEVVRFVLRMKLGYYDPNPG
ncbi:MAG: glycosyltransferase family 2 protein [Desulfobacteraceae bacterium]|nr:MAG: glycosyltransferase family 2 protein [Desulfobacteraceae bacterium]